MKRNANLLATFQYVKSLLGGEKQQKRTLVIALILIELLLIIGAYISYNNKNLDKYVFGNISTTDSGLFAVMIEDSNGNYQQSTDNNFPGYEYFYNQTKSGCMSSSGKQIEDSLLYDQDNKKATVKASETSLCYLYFDKYKTTSFADQLIDSGELWHSGLEGDGYRYTGSGAVGTSTNPNNFICFGTNNKSECTANQDKYMYRVLGVFSDSNGENHVKLIKYKQLISAKWNDTNADVNWENSTLYASLNGSGFLTNTTYDYLQNTTWSNKIENWTWSAVNTKTVSNSGPNYYNSLTPSQIYLHEMNRSTKTSTVGEWTTQSAKIGLMYASDYTLSLGSSALAITGSTDANKATLKTGWMHQSNNDTTKNTWEWTLSRRGAIGSDFTAWIVYSVGNVNNSRVDSKGAVRPVFYLTKNVTALGAGSLEDPFIITDEFGATSVPLKLSLSSSGSTLTATITKGTGNLNKYCINNKASINDCEWKNITSTTITYDMTSEGTYYVHVIDDAGYIAHSSYTYKSTTFADRLIASGNLWQSGLEGDGYRYTGSGAVGTSTNPNNFICFGTNNKSECTANQDKYMYRVLGVFSDSNGENHVKLIKYKQLISAKWNDTNADVNWENSTLYASLNGSGFLTNTTYDYLQDTTWSNRIENWTWSAVNTKTYEDKTNNPDYYKSSPKGIYLNEMHKTSTGTLCTNYNSGAVNCNGGAWTNPTSKIGLMYASDYALSLGSSALALTTGTGTNASLLKTGWMHPSNNDTTKGIYEWTLARYGDNGGDFSAWFVFADGYVSGVFVHSANAVRPVFYLTSNQAYLGGNGSLENPIIIN